MGGGVRILNFVWIIFDYLLFWNKKGRVILSIRKGLPINKFNNQSINHFINQSILKQSGWWGCAYFCKLSLTTRTEQVFQICNIFGERSKLYDKEKVNLLVTIDRKYIKGWNLIILQAFEYFYKAGPLFNRLFFSDILYIFRNTPPLPPLKTSCSITSY